MRWLPTIVVLASCSAPATTPAKPAGSPFESFATTAPMIGGPAPDFTLTDSDGARVRLSEATARGPVVLVWGSFT
jgi:cytochrome oxidase Cu insertion factor (SCO1/SenC/PrrC family)